MAGKTALDHFFRKLYTFPGAFLVRTSPGKSAFREDGQIDVSVCMGLTGVERGHCEASPNGPCDQSHCVLKPAILKNHILITEL